MAGRPEDSRSDPLDATWYVSQFAALLAFVCGAMIVWLHGAGAAGGPLAGRPIAAVTLGVCLMLGAIGVMLRIDAARLFLTGLTSLAVLALLGQWVVHVFGADPGRRPRVEAALGFAAFAICLSSRATRRMCSRWGLLRRR